MEREGAIMLTPNAKEITPLKQNRLFFLFFITIPPIIEFPQYHQPENNDYVEILHHAYYIEERKREKVQIYNSFNDIICKTLLLALFCE